MRANRFRAGIVFPSFQKDNRLFARNAPRNLHEPGSILNSFNIHRDDFRVFIFGKILEHISFGHVHLIAQASKVRKPDLRIDNQINHPSADRTGLRDEGNRSRGRQPFDESRVQTRANIDRSHTVGSHNPHPIRPRKFFDCPFNFCAFFAQFPEPACYDDHSLNAAFPDLFHRVHNDGDGQHHNRKFHRIRYIGD